MISGPWVQAFLGALHIFSKTNTDGSNCAVCLGVDSTGFLVGLDITAKFQAEIFGLVKLDACHDVSWTGVVWDSTFGGGGVDS